MMLQDMCSVSYNVNGPCVYVGDFILCNSWLIDTY